MKITINKGTARGVIAAPPSKSASHRVLLAAALYGDGCVLHGVTESADVTATMNALRALGSDIRINGDTATVGAICPPKSVHIDSMESGSTLRFMVPVCLALGVSAVFTGQGRLLSRPMTVYEEMANAGLFKMQKTADSVAVSGRLGGGEYTVRGDISSQFISGLIFALPLAERESVIHILPPVVSSPYIDMTIKTVRDFGVDASRIGNDITISPLQKRLSHEKNVEGDWSNAAFLSALNVLGGSVTVTGLCETSIQGDKAYIGFFRDILEQKPVDIRNTPDLGPVLLSLMAYLGGGTLTGTNRLRDKESDRGEAMKEELFKFGAVIEVGDDIITVKDTKLHAPTETLCSHNDHRIAMSLAVLCTAFGGTIDGAECVKKSYPAFWDDLKTLGISIE